MTRALARAGGAVLAVLLGLASAVPSVALHALVWPLPLVALTALALALALPPGWSTRVVFAVAWGVVVLRAGGVGPGEEYAVRAALPGYLLLALGLVLLVVALVTLPWRRARRIVPVGGRPYD